MASIKAQVIKQQVIEVVAVTALWILFYKFNLWMFSYFEYNPHIYWIFLPAGIRMITVFIFGWTAVLGIFIGSILTNEAEISNYVMYLAAISALAPMLAKRTCMWWFKTPVTLQGLTGKQLLIFALAGAFSNALFSNLYFHLYGLSDSLYSFLPMFIGDLAGTIIILYLSKGLLRLALTLYKRPHNPA